MTILKLSLPTSIVRPLTDYATSVLTTPGKYINHANHDYNIGVDPYDISCPGVTDEFISNKDLTNIFWGDHSLQTTKCDKLYQISYPPLKTSLTLIEFLEDNIQRNIIRPTGNFLYPIGGYMGWHTNGNMPGTRVYVTYSPSFNGSYFKFVDRDTNQIVTDWDNPGWTVRKFDVSQHPSNYLWHCVGAPNAPRISFGYWFK